MAAIFRDLFSPADADLALEDSKSRTVVVYKHSPICDLSDLALEQMQGYLRSAHPEADVRIVDVISSRPASQRMEAVTGVRHESPQVLVLRNGVAVWNTSHRRITAGAVAEAVASAPASAPASA